MKLAVFVHLTCFHPLLGLSCILAGQTGTQIFHSPSEFGSGNVFTQLFGAGRNVKPQTNWMHLSP